MRVGWASAALFGLVLVACSGGSDPSGGGDLGSGDQGSSSGGTSSGGTSSGGTSSGGTTSDAGSTHDSGSTGSDASASDASAPQDSGAPNDGFDAFQHHNLDVINMYRATLQIAPLTLDTKLSTFALAGSQELSMDHMPHQHFIDASNNGTLWSSGFTSSAGENQGDPNGWPKASSDATMNEMTQIDQIQKAMFDEGPGSGEAHGHYENMMNANFKRLGVGLLEVNGMLYLTNDFSN